MMTVTTWLVALMTWLSPPAKAAAGYHLPGWAETAPQRVERYEAIAEDLYQTLYNDAAVVPVFGGPTGRAKTAALLLAIARHETDFTPDADRGPCYGKRRCDGGKSACMMQVLVGEGRTKEGWSRAELFADRKKCFKAALRIIKGSWRACPSLGADGRLTVYARGTCSSAFGFADSQRKLRTTRYLWTRYPMPRDASALQASIR